MLLLPFQTAREMRDTILIHMKQTGHNTLIASDVPHPSYPEIGISCDGRTGAEPCDIVFRMLTSDLKRSPSAWINGSSLIVLHDWLRSNKDKAIIMRSLISQATTESFVRRTAWERIPLIE